MVKLKRRKAAPKKAQEESVTEPTVPQASPGPGLVEGSKKRRRGAVADAKVSTAAADAEVVAPPDVAETVEEKGVTGKRKQSAVEQGAPVLDGGVDGDEKEKEDRRGIIHLGQVPSGMQPEKLRHLMSQFGEVGRVYLAPEDKTERTRRRKTGGSRKLRYTEGWIEFAERKIARRVAMTLNATPIGGKKRHNYYRDDMWNMRYLPKFKWHQLKEATIYNQHVRKARLEQKLGQARRENEFFLEQVEKGKIRKRIERKYEEKGKSSGASTGAPVQSAAFVRPGAAKKNHVASDLPAPGQISERVLSNLF